MNTDMKKLVQEGYENAEYGAIYRIGRALDPFETKFLDLLAQHIPDGADILDLGSGLGVPYDKYLVAQGYRVTGIDFCQKHVDFARKNVPQANYICGDFSQVTFAASFDAIVSFYAIFHLPRQEHFDLFGRMYKKLKPGGVILVTLGASDSDYGQDDWCGATMAWSTYDSETYKQLLARAGFTILYCAFEGQPGDEEYHFWVLAKRP